MIGNDEPNVGVEKTGKDLDETNSDIDKDNDIDEQPEITHMIKGPVKI